MKKTPYVDQFTHKEWEVTRSAKLKPPFILFHGGLGDQLAKRLGIFEGLKKVGLNAKTSLEKSALEMVHATVYALESHPVFNAGYGSKLQRDGIARLSASLMDGERERMAAIANIVGFKHPSDILMKLIEDSDRNLCSLEASAYALQQGFVPERVEVEDRVLEWKRKIEGKTGTVGAIAIDRNGKIAACTSTGGRGAERPGRMSDSFTPAGNFANPFGAVSCTGMGEQILEAAVASTIVARLEDGMSLSEAVSKTYARHREKRFGSISLDHRGHALIYATRGAISFGLITTTKIYTGILPEHWNKTCLALSSD